MIIYDDVSKTFNGTPVLENVSFKVNKGEIVVLLGPNGSGKSTLFKMSIGVIKPDKGKVFVNGIDASHNPLEARKAVGYIPEENILYESLKPEEFIEFILSIYNIKNSRSLIEKIIDLLDLREHMGKLIGELSHGTRRKILLASVMLRTPPIYVLDEVFTGLDPASARTVKSFIREEARRGKSILVSTHVLAIAEAIADRVLIIYEGKIVAQGKPEELKDIFGAKELEDVYLKVTGYRTGIEDLIKALYE